MEVAMKTPVLLISALLLSLLALNVSAITQGEAFNQYLKDRRSRSTSKTGFKAGPDQVPAVESQKGLKEEDWIQRLPGQPPVAFRQYGGYITINPSAGSALYYYFTEAQNPAKAEQLPLVLWLNGGPGCSSLGFGAMQELGPFRVGSDGKTLFKNQFAWNHAANVLFLESPAGVGFSYSNRTQVTGDTKTAADNLVFLLNWLERFPEYKDRDFFIAGESYAGHYVPQLAYNIINYNHRAKNNTIKLKGIMIGNAVINGETDNLGMYEYWESHALISRETLQAIKRNCDFSPNATTTDECTSILNTAGELYDEIDVYNIYYPRCLKDEDEALTPTPKPFSIVNADPCSQYYTTAYLNRPEVQKAMHANVTKLNYPWSGCGNVEYVEHAETVLPILKELMQNGIRVLKFSGDIDGRVPITSTLNSLAAMKVSILKPWSAWYLAGEVGGYTQYYQSDLTFVSVRNAGHQVPSYTPARSLSLFSHFLSATPLPVH